MARQYSHGPWGWGVVDVVLPTLCSNLLLLLHPIEQAYKLPPVSSRAFESEEIL